MTALEAILFFFILCGHLGVWCILFSQIHATSLPRKLRKFIEKLVFCLMTLVPILMALNELDLIANQVWMTPYRTLCLIVFAALSLRWIFQTLTSKPPAALLSEEVELLDLGERIPEPHVKGLQARILSWVPRNQILKLSIEKRELQLDHWPLAMDGMVIAHLSDLHFTGKISRAYFEKVCQECNACLPDYIFLTGDIIDSAACLEWLPETLGKLNCKYHKYFVLGNHDLRIRDEEKLVAALESCGFKRASGSWEKLAFKEGEFSIAGDELPWFSGAENMAKPSNPAILLAHSPDRIYPASQLEIDLVLAGHCHGGQIRLPVIGPIVAPSVYGIRFASGTFKVAKTLMHVTRGISGDEPIRWNCPPELNVIRLRSPK